MSAALSAVVSEVVGIAVVAAAGIVAVAAVEIVAAADRKLRPDVGGKPDVAAQTQSLGDIDFAVLSGSNFLQVSLRPFVVQCAASELGE